MSVLRKKIDKSLGTPELEAMKLQQYWEQTQELYLKGCENLIDALHWKNIVIKVSQGSLVDIKATLPAEGLYSAYGTSPKEAHAIFLLDSKLAAIISKHGFSGKISNFNNIDAHQISKIDSLMMDSLIDATHRSLSNPMWPVRSDYLELADLPFAPHLTDFVKLEFVYEVSFGPKSEGQTITFNLIVPLSYMLPRLEVFTQKMVPETVVEYDATSEILSRHIDHSVTPLRAILENCKMTVADCTRLEIGQIIPLPGVSLQEMRLEAKLRDDKVCVVTGALGIHKSKRAVKLTEDLSPDFVKAEFSTFTEV